MATIEVLLPIKNTLAFLGESIESVRSQTFQDWRLHILDHGSTDGSCELARKYSEGDKRIVVYANTTAPGLGGLLNFGLEKVDGRFVVRQDGDDISAPNRFQVIVDAFEDEPDLVLVGGEAVTIDRTGREVGYMLRPNSHAGILAASFFSNPFIHSAMAMNFSQISKVGGAYGRDILKVLPSKSSIEVLGPAQDYFLFAQLAMLGPCRNLKLPLIKYRYHEQSVGASKRLEQTTSALRISRFLAMSFSAMKGTSAFDPTPFCTHGGTVFDCGLTDYSTQFDRLAKSLIQGLGQSPELHRELAFRRLLAKRNFAAMATSYAGFVCKNGFRTEEYLAIRNWLGRFITDKYVMKLETDLSHESEDSIGSSAPVSRNLP